MHQDANANRMVAPAAAAQPQALQPWLLLSWLWCNIQPQHPRCPGSPLPMRAAAQEDEGMLLHIAEYSPNHTPAAANTLEEHQTTLKHRPKRDTRPVSKPRANPGHASAPAMHPTLALSPHRAHCTPFVAASQTPSAKVPHQAPTQTPHSAVTLHCTPKPFNYSTFMVPN